MFDENAKSTDYWKLLVLNFSEMGNTGGGGILSQKVDGKIIFINYWKVLGLDVSEMGNTIFFWVKKLIERWNLLITENLFFWTFRWLEQGLFFSQKVDGKMIFTWSFWAFHDILGLWKYVFFEQWSLWCIS